MFGKQVFGEDVSDLCIGKLMDKIQKTDQIDE